MNRLTARILDASNSLQNTNLPIHEIVFVSPTPYYLYWFEKYYPSVTLDRYGGPFCLQLFNEIQITKLYGLQCNRLIDAVVTILKYQNMLIYHTIYIKVLSDVTVSYLIVSTDDVINTTNNETAFPEIRKIEECFEIKVQEGSVLGYIYFRIYQSYIGFSIDQNDHIMELVREWLQTRKFRSVDTHFLKESTYEKGIMSELPLTGNTLCKAEIEYHGNFGHTIFRIQHISIMSIIDI